MQMKALKIISGPLLAMVTYWLCTSNAQSIALSITAGIAVWCAAWWLTEAVDAPITALIPIALLPLLNVLSAKQVAESVGHELILLLMGGFMLSRALERSGAHQRLAMQMVHAFGARSGRSLLYGFIATAGFISMWISNTATTLLLLPVAIAILQNYPDQRLHAPLILSIAYAASVGGLGTPIGTPPNLVFMQVYEQSTGQAYGFIEWMKVGVPVVLIFLPLMAIWLGRHLHNAPAATLPAIGAWSKAERRVIVVFALTACAWIFRSEPFGGWTELLGLQKTNDASVALLAVLALCLIPNGEPADRGAPLLDWKSAVDIPWGALILFAGGICLANGLEASGLSEKLASSLAVLNQLSLPLLLISIIACVILLSEFTSNTATAVLLMPVMASTAKAINVEPALLMLPVAMAASIGFMLPVATAPNAIAYGTGEVTAKQMQREGFVLDIFGAVILCIVCYVVFS
jgi:solute carrier family 13 (sodium-dependent dicarboxylate transporter), member 2/3/5